ncbi:AAA family ATPase [Methylobacterium nodulans]|uniref:Response regulator receiver protein n=1 Tax=Methylobacterium nodulans (strain LMG 21967 / CNCM I-2342 / ORS 2060) TaxID=460265 RepID=B8IRF3_METNO|nr:AAA family ATPase [Methylobacterium nodulans]ACL58693.1 response regulator receiver protein [Methylobacterium nodulans ORS 2060]
MTNLAFKITAPAPQGCRAQTLDTLRVPQISVHAFCDTPETAATLEAAFADRRMSRAHASVYPGGIPAAAAHYRQATTPNLLVLEASDAGSRLLADLEILAEVCDRSTKVVVIGKVNDIRLYRELLDRGISEYLVAPVEPVGLIAAVAQLYRDAGASKLGRSLAFIGAKGGVGSSVVAHNVAAAIARSYDTEVILADLDLPFGSASLALNLDQEKGQGIADALANTGRLDDVLLERLLTKSGEHLSVLSAPATLDHCHDLDGGAFERLIEVAQASVPFVVLDLPHVWMPWAKSTLLAADEVVITATPDLTSLRNAKNLISFLTQARPNDALPKLVLNQVGVPKRAEIKVDKFAAALELEPAACIPFEASVFSTAANEGRLVADVSAKARACSAFDHIARVISGRNAPAIRKGRFSLERFRRTGR